MSFVVDNDSVNFGGIITGDVTLTSWGRLIYTILATGDITITLPPEPKPNNIVESGSISFIRVDSDASNTVTVVVDVGGFPTSYKIYPNPLDVHKFKTIYDPTNQLQFTTLYSVDGYGVVEGSERVLRDVVDTVATTNQNTFASNYIGLTINGVTLAVGDSLLLTAQGNQYENGAYKVDANGTISYRASEPLGMDGRYHVFPVKRGDYAGYSYRVTNAINPLAPALYQISSLKIDQYQSTFALGGDVTSLPPVSGVATSTVNSVGGKTAAEVAQSVTDTLAATDNVIAGTIVKRTSAGGASFNGLGAQSFAAVNASISNLGAVTMTGSIDSTNYNVLVKNPTNLAAGSKDAVNYGTLLTSLSSLAAPITQLQSDVTTPAGASGVVNATVASVGGKTAAAVAQSVTDTVAATSANTVSTIVKRDSFGNFAANNITAAIVSLGANATLSSQAPTWGQVQSYVSLSRVNIKSVATVATTNQSISASSYIGQTINGRTLAVGDRLALIGNNTPVENGVYVVQAGGGILRSSDCAAGVDGNGFVFGVLYGTFANYFYRISPSGSNTTAIFGTDVNVYDVYFIIQNLVADGTSISLTGNTLSVATSGVGTTQLAPYATGNRIMGTNSGTKKPEETSIASDKLAAAMVSSLSYVNVSNFGSDTLGNGYLVPYATLTTALANTTGAGVIRCLGGYGATGAFTQSQDNQQIEGIGCDGSQITNITGSITAPSGRTRLKLKDLTLTGNAANPTPYIAASGNLGRNYFKNVTFIPYTTNPSISINAAIQNWHEFDNCDFTNAVIIGGAVGAGEAYTFRNARGAIYLYLTKNVPVTFIDCDAVFVMSHTAGQILVYGRSTVNIASTATLASGALIYLEGCTTWNSQTQSWGAINSACTTQLNNVSRKATNDNIAALTTLKTPVVPSTAATNYYVSGVDQDGTLLTSLLPSAPTKDVGTDTAVTINNTNSPYPLTATQTVVNVDASTGSVIITLPPIAAVSTSLLNKRYTIHRTDVMNGNAVIIQCNSGTTDSFQRTPVGFTQYFLGTAGSIQLTAVIKGGGNVWVIENTSQSLYQGLPFDNLITSDTIMTYHGSLFTVYATSNTNITLPLSTYGVGSTKIIRIDQNTQYDVNLVAPASHTVNGTSSVKLGISGTATCRTISYGNNALVAELAQDNSAQGLTKYGCAYTYTNGTQTVPGNTNTFIQFPSSSGSSVSTSYDPNNMHNNALNNTRFYAPVGGKYILRANIILTTSGALNTEFGFMVWYKNGSQGNIGVTANWVNSIWLTLSMDDVIEMNKGDYIELVTNQSHTSSTVVMNRATIELNLAQNTVGSGTAPSATCQIAMSGSNVQTVTNTGTIFSFPSSASGYTTYDPTGMHNGTTNTSRIVIQTAGIYEVSCYFRIIDWGNVTGTGCQIIKNGTTVITDNWQPTVQPAGIGINSHKFIVNCAVGDYLEMKGFIYGVAGGDGVLAAAFSATLGQGTPSNLPSLGSAGQVLTVNSGGTGLQYSTILNSSSIKKTILLNAVAGGASNWYANYSVNNSNSVLFVHADVTGYAVSGGTNATINITIDGVVVSTRTFSFNLALNHTTLPPVVWSGSLAGGSHTFRITVSNLTTDGNDTANFWIEEVYR